MYPWAPEDSGGLVVLDTDRRFSVRVRTYAGKYLLPPRLHSPLDPSRFKGSHWDRTDPALSAPSDCDIYGALFLNVEGRG